MQSRSFTDPEARERRMARRRRGFGRRRLDSINCIKEIEPKIHRIAFSSKDLTYSEIEKRIGKMKRLQEPVQRMPHYATWTVRQLPDIKLTIFTGPDEGYRPKSYFEFCFPSDPPKVCRNEVEQTQYQRSILLWLNDKLPGLKVSEVEYAVDFYTVGSRSPEYLHRHFTKYLFVGYARDIRIEGGEETEIGSSMRMNYITTGSAYKFYERGRDSQKNHDSHAWPDAAFDRVRLEYTANRAKLRELGLTMLTDLLENPMFAEVYKKRFEFYIAKISSKHLPKEWEKYRSFQQEFQRAVTLQGETVYQQREKVDYFKRLQTDFYEMVAWFDAHWNDPTVPRPVREPCYYDLVA